MKTPISKNEKILYILWTLVLVSAILFFIVYHIFDLTLYTGKTTCGFKYFFHLYCPGCGGTRAIDNFLHGNFIQSFLHHPLILYIACFFISYYIPATLRMMRFLRKPVNDMVYVFLLIGVLVLILFFFVFRNILLVHFQIDTIGDCISYWT